MTEQSPPRRKPTNLSLEPDLVAEARRLGVNISRAAEDGIRGAVRAAAARRWQEENAEGIRQLNAYVEKHGLPLAKYRMF
jgi:antitoxin CcdA